MQKIHDAQGCIVDAQNFVGLLEIIADHLDTREGATISGTVRLVGEKLTQALQLLDETETKAKAA